MKHLIPFLLLFLTACTLLPEERQPRQCTTDNDCMKAGCSSQLCTTKTQAPDIITTCEYKPEYACYQQATCGCVQGACTWKDQANVNQCVQDKKTPQESGLQPL
ncbi:MAG TPA: eight-cysteine-cluster domain-containing protein [Candidatus Nanoarchaeia archaeon]|nr:eight-cysteine-cluster domain-containing protein [Candidatus Nanoarchaeia archaeon]